MEKRLALKKKLPVTPVEKPPVAKLPEPQVMRGYIIQLLFSDRAEAEHWSGRLSRKGYFTSMSIVEGNQSVRLRVGNFALHAEANNILGRLREQGLNGSVLHLAPGPKPAVRTPSQKKAAERNTQLPSAMLKPRLSPPAPRVAPKRAGPSYMIQLSFPDRAEAEHWSGRLSRKGYFTSMSIVEGNQSVRLRVGTFTSLGEAENLLGRLRKQGLTGFILRVSSRG